MKQIGAVFFCVALLLALLPVAASSAAADGGAAAPVALTLPVRPTAPGSKTKTYLAFPGTNAQGAPVDVYWFGAASAALYSGGTIVVTGKAFYSFKESDATNTVDGTRGTVLVTAKEGKVSYIDIGTDSKEKGVILGNNNFSETNWDKVDYLRLKGSVILDDVVLFNRAHKNPDPGNLEPMEQPNTVLALAGSRVVIGSGVQFASREAVGEIKLGLPNMALEIEKGAVVFLDAVGFSSYTGKGVLVVNKDLAGKVSEDDFAGFEGSVVNENGKPLFASDPAPAALTLPARPTAPGSSEKVYLAFPGTNAQGAPAEVYWFGAASAALYNGGTIVVTGKAFYSFKESDATNTVDGTRGTVLVTAKEGKVSYIDIGTDSKEKGVILGNNNFSETNWDKVDYLRLKGSVILDDVVLFNRAHKNPDPGNLEPMEQPNTVLALAGSRVVIGSGVQFASREAVGEIKLGLPNMALEIEKGAVVFLDAVGFSSYTGKGVLVVNKDLAGKVSEDDFAGFEGSVVNENGEPFFAASGPAASPETGSKTVTLVLCAILASAGALAAGRKKRKTMAF